MPLTAQPYHTRVFNLEDSQFTMTGVSLDDWLASELADGYLPNSIVALPSDNSHLRVTTEYQPDKAKKHPASAPSTPPKASRP